MAASNVVHDIAPVPNRTISCQDLLKDQNCVYSGWLRRQSLRNKLKIFAWPQVYVAIAGGCVYCYGNEVSRRPASAFSLYGYDKVFRAGEITEKEATWTFKLVHVNPAYRSYLFSSSSEREMAHWMSHMKQEMLRANGKLPKGPKPKTSDKRTPADGSSWETPSYQDAGSESAGSITSQDLKDIETNIYEDTSHFVLPSDYTNKKEEDDSDDEMDRVVLSRPDLQERPPLPPPVPHRPDLRKQNAQAGVVNELKKLNVGNKGGNPSSPGPVRSSQEMGKPVIDRTSKPMTLRGDPDGSSAKKEDEIDANEFWSSIFFYGGKEKAHDIITKIADDGVYLVRVNEDKSMVLHMYGKQQARKFIIFKNENKYALDKACPQFERVADLVYHYYDNPLPRVDICLSECYLHHPDYHTLSWS